MKYRLVSCRSIIIMLHVTQITPEFERNIWISVKSQKLWQPNMILITHIATDNFRCRCRECAPVGGGESVHCCHHDPLYWNSVRTEHVVLTHNTPSLCVTQHPGFTLNYLNVANLEKHFPHLKNQQTSGKFKSRFRYICHFCVGICLSRICLLRATVNSP